MSLTIWNTFGNPYDSRFRERVGCRAYDVYLHEINIRKDSASRALWKKGAFRCFIRVNFLLLLISFICWSVQFNRNVAEKTVTGYSFSLSYLLHGSKNNLFV